MDSVDENGDLATAEPIDTTVDVAEHSININPFSRFLYFISRWMISFFYGLVSGLIPGKDKEKYDSMIENLTNYDKTFAIDENGEIITEVDMGSRKLIKNTILVLDIVISIATVALIGYGAWFYFTKMG